MWAGHGSENARLNNDRCRADYIAMGKQGKRQDHEMAAFVSLELESHALATRGFVPLAGRSTRGFLAEITQLVMDVASCIREYLFANLNGRNTNWLAIRLRACRGQISKRICFLFGAFLLWLAVLLQMFSLEYGSTLKHLNDNSAIPS